MPGEGRAGALGEEGGHVALETLTVSLLSQCLGTESGDASRCRSVLSPCCTCFVLQFSGVCGYLSLDWSWQDLSHTESRRSAL